MRRQRRMCYNAKAWEGSHVDCSFLSMQSLNARKVVQNAKVPGIDNPADVCTKELNAELMTHDRSFGFNRTVLQHTPPPPHPTTTHPTTPRHTHTHTHPHPHTHTPTHPHTHTHTHTHPHTRTHMLHGKELRRRMSDQRQVEGEREIRWSMLQLQEDGSQKQRRSFGFNRTVLHNVTAQVEPQNQSQGPRMGARI